jgi:Zn-dependent peptidase ImmA (M78 family)/transcriptional regulator with XRE-family HTH domain
MDGLRTSRLATALFDGERLRQARLYRGWRKVDLARELDLTPAAVGQYEGGRARPSQAVLASLALRAGFAPEFFERGRDRTHVAEGQVHFRSLRSTSKLARDRMLIRLELLAEVLVHVEHHVRLPAVSVPSVEVEDEHDLEGAEQAAALVRAEWGLGKGPIDNVVRLLEGKGVVVIRPEVDSDEVDAFSTWAGQRPLVVLASDKDDCARSRFDAAHELGHLVMHHDAEPGRKPVEDQAQRFAGAFLMPAGTIVKELPARMSWPVYFDLKQRWCVSLQALLYRARTLGALSPDAYQRGQAYLSRQWGRGREPINLGRPEQPVLLERALDLMRVQLGITLADVAAEARLPADVLNDLVADAVAPSVPRPEVPVRSGN